MEEDHSQPLLLFISLTCIHLHKHAQAYTRLLYVQINIKIINVWADLSLDLVEVVSGHEADALSHTLRTPVLAPFCIKKPSAG